MIGYIKRSQGRNSWQETGEKIQEITYLTVLLSASAQLASLQNPRHLLRSDAVNSEYDNIKRLPHRSAHRWHCQQWTRTFSRNMQSRKCLTGLSIGPSDGGNWSSLFPGMPSWQPKWQPEQRFRYLSLVLSTAAPACWAHLPEGPSGLWAHYSNYRLIRSWLPRRATEPLILSSASQLNLNELVLDIESSDIVFLTWD